MYMSRLLALVKGCHINKKILMYYKLETKMMCFYVIKICNKISRNN